MADYENDILEEELDEDLEEELDDEVEEEIDEEAEQQDELDLEEAEEELKRNGSSFFNVPRDNGVDWYTGERRITASFSQRKWINKIRKFAEKYPDEVEIVSDKGDGSITAHLPLSYFKLSPPRKVSEEQKERMRLQAQKNIAEGKFGKKKTNDTVVGD